MLKFTIAILTFFVSTLSISAEFIAGSDYELVAHKLTTATINTKPLELIEFFSFACPGCYKIESALSTWMTRNAAYIHVKKVPVVFNPAWQYYARAYYIALQIPNTDLNQALFKAILIDKLKLQDEQAMIDFLKSYDIKLDIAKNAYNHHAEIESALKNAQKLMGIYHINAIPAFIVNNQYKVDMSMAKTPERLFAILDFLISKAQSTSH